MLADRAMWASVCIVDNLRDGTTLEDARDVHAGRALAALAWLFRIPLDAYWESQLPNLGGANYGYMLEQNGYTMLELVPIVGEHTRAIEDCLAHRSFTEISALPRDILRLLQSVTGMAEGEWEALPSFCRSLLVQDVVCPECAHTAPMRDWGKPHPIDDPLWMYSQRISLVFDCPTCGTDVTYDIVHSTSREFVAVPWSIRRILILLGALSIGAFSVGLFVWFLLTHRGSW